MSTNPYPQVYDAGDLRKYRTEIPDEVQDRGLNVHEFRLYVHLKRRYDNNMPPISVRELASRCNMSIGSVVRAKQGLVDKGLVAVSGGMTATEAMAWCQIKQGQVVGHTPSLRQCKWCKGETLIFHEHHFPISKQEGGAETVSICPNCHHEYHALISDSLSLTARGRGEL